MLLIQLISNRVFGLLCIISLMWSLAACDADGGNNLPGIPGAGLVMYAEANQHGSEDEAQVAAAVYLDGKPVAMVGGDVFVASTVTERVLLNKPGFFGGSYAALLPVDSTVQDVYFDVVHEPIAAREDRWYPIDILNIDPGPGELVGKSAMVSFPPEVSITGPVDGDIYQSINDVIQLTWVAGGAGDTMRVLSAIKCDDGLATSSYGTVIEINHDLGLEAITMDKFIYDILDEKPGLTFISDAVQVMLQELLNKLSAGNIDPDFLLRKVDANPIDSTCEIRLFLQRKRQGQFDVTFAGGTVFGSRSAETAFTYLPIVPTN